MIIASLPFIYNSHFFPLSAALVWEAVNASQAPGGEDREVEMKRFERVNIYNRSQNFLLPV